MFAKMLLDDEKECFIKLLIYLSNVDGKAGHEEIQFVKNIGYEIGVDSAGLWDSVDAATIEDLVSNISSPLSKNIVVMELINIAAADGNYLEKERAGILSIANLMNVPVEKVVEIEKWVQEGKIWASQGFSIISA